MMTSYTSQVQLSGLRQHERSAIHDVFRYPSREPTIARLSQLLILTDHCEQYAPPSRLAIAIPLGQSGSG